MLKANTSAPEFSLPSAPDQTLGLSKFRGKNVVLTFYSADWDPVCGDQLSLYNEMLPYFKKYNALLIGISVDSKWSHQAFRKERKLQFPLLADFNPKGRVSKLYGVFDAIEGNSQRAIFVIDAEGIIRWSYLSPVEINPGGDGISEALQKLSHK